MMLPSSPSAAPLLALISKCEDAQAVQLRRRIEKTQYLLNIDDTV